jgi:xanthine/CO dehydrogenase XdhC/CoxF family maturation factor
MTIEHQILDAAARLRRQREPHLIATVVRVQGSAYRRPGARMVLTRFRWITGSVSGGCLEGDIGKKGWWRTQDGEPIVVTYDSRIDGDADDDDIRSAFGIGCNGVVDVMLERAGTTGRLDALAFASGCIAAQQRGAIATVIRSDVPAIKVGSRVAVRGGETVHADELLQTAMLADARAATATGESSNRTYASARGSVDVFIEAIVPPPRVFVLGTGHDAVPVVELARQLGWDVTVCADQVRVTTRERFRRADEIIVGTPAELAARIEECDRPVAIVMNHNYDRDRLHLSMLLESRATYVGVLGPRARTARMLDELGVILGGDTRLHAPIGLTIGAETPHEIALAIAAEITAVLARVPAHSLRDRSGPIHARPMPRIAREIETVALVEPRPSREIAAVGDVAAAGDVEPVQRVSREIAVATAAPSVA